MEGRFEPESGNLSTLIRWGVAGSLVIALHGAAAYALLNRAPLDAPPAGAPEAAILIDLQPPAESEAAPPPPEVALPEPAVEPPPPEPVAEPVPEPTPPEPVPPEPVVEPLPEPVPPEPVVEPLPEPEPPPPEVVEETPPDPPVVEEVAPVPGNVPLPMMRPPPPRPPEPKVERRPVERVEPRRQRQEPPPQRREARRAVAQPPASTASRGAPDRQASQGAPVSAASSDRWKGRILARLNRYKRTPRGSDEGTVSVSFVVDGSGRVTSARVTRSAGGTLDEAALALVRRAGPYPSPPSGAATTINVPIRFNQG